MYYRLNNFVFIRNINNYLQIIDARTNEELIGDFAAYLFAKHLSYLPKSFNAIVDDICSEFSDIDDVEVVKADVISFLDKMVDFGFVSSSETQCFQPEDSDIRAERPKILLPKEDLDKYQSLNRQYPCLQSVMVEITSKCNERCIHCYVPHENKNTHICDEDFYGIVDMCSEMKTITQFRITGGECMLHPSFKKFIRYVKERGFALTILTNLTLLDDETIDILKEGTMSQVQVSMFSVEDSVHDAITTISGSLEKTKKNIEKLIAAGIHVSIACQVMEINKNSIEGLYEYAKSKNISVRLDWTIVAKENRECDNLSCRVNNLSDYKNVCRLKVKYTNGYMEEFTEGLTRPLKADITHLCNAGAKGLYIDTHLDVHPCPGWDLSVGNLKDQSLSDIWSGSKILQRVRDVVLKDFPKCAKCNIRNFCSICMAQADLEKTANDFKFEMPEYMCSMYEVIYNTFKEDVLDA